MTFRCENCKNVKRDQTQGLRKKFRFYADGMTGKPRKDLIYVEKVCMACFERHGEEI